MPVAAITVSGLVVRYGPVLAVDGIDLSASFGEVLAVLGRNGAGKTSTVEALEGYRPAAAGTLRVLGLDPHRVEDHVKLTRRVGVMLQQGGVYPAMTPREALRLWAAYYDNPLDPAELLERMGLVGTVAATPWRRLSGGEQQRLSLALALVGRPEVVFLDEPTAGVDPQGRLAIRGVIGELRDAGVCVVMTTHELDEAERVADRIVIIDQGRLVAAGTAAELTSGAGPSAGTGGGAGGAGIRFRAPAGLDTAALGEHLRASVLSVAAGEYLVAAPGTPAVIAALTGWLAEQELPLSDLRTGERLEDVFLRLTASRAPDSEPRGEAAAARGSGSGSRFRLRRSRTHRGRGDGLP